MTRIKYIIFTISISFISNFLNAQTDFRDGYIIKIAGDTVYGQIDYRGDLLMGKTCKFKSKDKNITSYTPKDISSFRFIDGKLYVSKRIDENDVFLEFLINGRVNIYFLRDEKGDRFFIDKEDADLREIPYLEEYRNVDDNEVLYKSTKHIGVLSYYMIDAPVLHSRITSIEKPEHRELIKLAEDYHNTVCKDEECIIYEKYIPKVKVSFEAICGVSKFLNSSEDEEDVHFQYGVLAHFWLPRANEKLYLKTGLLFSHNSNTDESYLRIPLHIGYIAPKTYLIRPTISIGLGLLTPSYSGGFYIRLSENINLGAQAWTDFEGGQVPFIPSKLNDYSIVGSIFIEL